MRTVVQDGVGSIAACGSGDVSDMVMSLSQRSVTGDDQAYLAWHLFDHLPEQYRLDGLRLGARYVSTEECRRCRPVRGEFDAVDHVVIYLAAPKFSVSIGSFFDLGAALRRDGRMSSLLPSVHLAAWTLAGRVAASRAVVGASVIPWRPATGILLLVERDAEPSTALPDDHDGLAALIELPGVVGAWTWRGRSPLHPGLSDATHLAATVAYLDGPPTDVATRATDVLAARWDDGRREPLLAAPFHAVDPFALDRFLPGTS